MLEVDGRMQKGPCRMIPLSSTQVDQYARPLIRLTMGDEIANSIEEYDEPRVETDFYGLFDMDKLIAIGGLGSVISPKKVWLGYWTIHPNYRNKGVGSRVLDFIEELAASLGYKWIFVETYDSPLFEKALKAYKKRGYKEIGYLSDYTEDDSDALYLRKTLI